MKIYLYTCIYIFHFTELIYYLYNKSYTRLKMTLFISNFFTIKLNWNLINFDTNLCNGKKNFEEKNNANLSFDVLSFKKVKKTKKFATSFSTFAQKNESFDLLCTGSILNKSKKMYL